MATTPPKVGDIVQYRIAEHQYRPLLVVKVRIDMDSLAYFLTGYLFPDLWNDDKHLRGRGGDIGFLRYVLDVPQGDRVGQWKFIE